MSQFPINKNVDPAGKLAELTEKVQAGKLTVEAAKAEVEKEFPQSKDNGKSNFNPTRFLVGTYLDPIRGEWMIAQVPLDTKTLVTGPVVTTRVAGDFEVMKERLAIKIVQLGLHDAQDIKQETNTNLY